MSGPLKTVPEDTFLEHELRKTNQALLISSIRQHELTQQAQESEHVQRELSAQARKSEQTQRHLTEQAVQAQHALSESEERYRTLFNSMDEGYCIIEVIFDERERPVDYRFLEVNPAFENQSGMHDVVGKRMLEFVPSIEGHWLANYGRAALTGEPIRFANEYKTLNRWFDVYAFKVGEQGARKVAVLFTDITQRRQTEEALRRSEEGLARELAATQQLQAISAQLIEGSDSHALYQKIASAAAAIMRSDFASMQMLHPDRGGGRGELNLLAFVGFHPEAAAFWTWVRADSQCACGRALSQGERVTVPDVEHCDWMAGSEDQRTYRQAGIRAVQSTPLFSRDRRLLGMISTHWRAPHAPSEEDFRQFDILARQAADLIERKAGEEATARLASIVTSSDDAIISKDLNGIIATWNRGAERLFGYTAEEVIGQPVTILIPEDHIDEEPQILERIRHGESIEHYQTVRRRKDGTRVDISLTVSPLRDAAGKVIGASKVARDISDLKQAADALRLADQRKNEFLAMLAHELRNPMAAISNAIHLSRTPQLGEGDQAWVREMLDRQMDQLGRLVDDLLDVSRITHGRINFQPERLPLDDLVKQAVEAVRPQIDLHRHRLSVAKSRETLWVQADRARLTQVLLNLLSNAAKYTPPGGDIWLHVKADGGDAVVSVRDSGIGIARDMLPKVFDMFVQAEQGLARSQGGLGIGLTLVRKLVEMHGGLITVESPGPGQGSTFTVRLPLAGQPTASPPRSSLPQPARSETEDPSPAPAQSVRILIVDDNRDAAQTLSRLLRLAGHTTEVVFDGSQALQAAAQSPPQLALLDIGLPGMDGYELAGRLKQAHPGLYVAAISGYGQAADRQRAKEAGFDRHFVKPVKLESLLQLLKERS